MKNMERLEKHLESGISTAKGVDGDFIYITVGDAKRVLKMIKEREPVEPKKDLHLYRCGNCNEMLVGKGKYCSFCGRPVKQK